MDISEAFRTVDKEVAGGRVGARFHPYRDLKHTWRLRDGQLGFRISDYMRGAPDEVIVSLAWFLICRARGKECPKRLASMYIAHVRSPEFWDAHRSLYMSRARNLLFRPKGCAHDLTAVFEYVNACYFNGEMAAPSLAWARGSPTRRMGYIHAPLEILAVNKVLDSDQVPRFVIEFVVYHELLHWVMGCGDVSDRRVYHTKEFRSREREFKRYDEAQKWLADVAATSRGNPRPAEIVPQA